MAITSEVKVITQKELDVFVNKLISLDTYEVVGVQSKGERFVFAPLDQASDLRLDYDVTILPPKKYMLPPHENLMEFDLQQTFEVSPNTENQQRIIIGIHPYDIIALEQMDTYYLDEQKDDFYKKRRDNTVIIGVDIQKVSPRSFAASMNTHVTTSGYDLLLTHLGSNYAISIGSKKGKQLLETYALTKESKPEDVQKIEKIHDDLFKKYKKKVKLEKTEWSKTLVSNYDHALWEEKSDRCLECSSCTMVCPTCYCYDIQEEVDLNLKDGRRVRTWDGCLLHDFTKVGSGEVFRDNIRDRFRHRFFRKGNYLPERFGFVACVGCGRCGTACLPDIADPCDVMNELSHFDAEEDTGKFFIKQKTENAEKGIIHIPRSATLKRVEKFNDHDILYEIELDDKKSLGHKPGQFIELSIFGYGEAPFGITSAPSEKPTFEILVRLIGSVTKKLASMKPGDKVGIRGPLGNGFDMKTLEGKHLLLTSGGTGIAPMRSLINYCLDTKHRKNFGDITILYGCKQSCEVLFADDIEEWKKVERVTTKLTVDRCEEGECWVGETGLITTLFPKIGFNTKDADDTIAVVIGPPVMYKFVIKCLQTMGILDENIYVSLERRMKCGVGKCGHCQINGIYVCKEGPVFNYAQIKELPEAFE